jgi:hypothetical protein
MIVEVRRGGLRHLEEALVLRLRPRGDVLDLVVIVANMATPRGREFLWMRFRSVEKLKILPGARVLPVDFYAPFPEVESP